MAEVLFFQEAQRKHLGPPGASFGALAIPQNGQSPHLPHPMQHIINSTKDPVQALLRQTALPRCLYVNKHPSVVRDSSTGEYVLSFCFNPWAHKTGKQKHVVELLVLRPLFTETFNEWNGFPSAGLKIQTATSFHKKEDGGEERSI